ncbi:hypothetical protein ASPZODRAFT_26793 [Penicilliopsis zonata CBS 506.65]|uniref:t-SNARE coiled-coil homology domain-containing protein n=1 Tax=Penicilliopsis zonata CBS 506.65 TaxID=1073090 RepID=A0A1L9SEA2_9EURO|nr:hypothetical protein ASPZODRAFT_26793 [Penicilliopsis zonata CBS 506.65]OJJ45443.1 hypothetical protein ASPZODRAFT_26793 [Penicilliopsis zonata CBS 506.65]
MSDAYEREQQNNALLNSLSSKVSALKSVTIDIYDNSNSRNVDETSEVFSSLGTNLKGSANRLTRMARQGDTVAVLKVAGIVVGVGVGGWLVLGWIF